MKAGELPAAMTMASSTGIRIGRAPFLLLGMLLLLAGLWGEIARMGCSAPFRRPGERSSHWAPA